MWSTRFREKSSSFLSQNTRNSKIFFLPTVKKGQLRALVIEHTVHLLRHDAYCPIKAEIRAVDSQSDLRILLFMINILITSSFLNLVPRTPSHPSPGSGRELGRRLLFSVRTSLISPPWIKKIYFKFVSIM